MGLKVNVGLVLLFLVIVVTLALYFSGVFPFAVTRTVAVAVPVEKVSVDPEVPTPAEPVKWLTLSGFDYGGNDMTGSPFTKSTQDECIDRSLNPIYNF